MRRMDNTKIDELIEEIRASQIEIARLRERVEAAKEELYAIMKGSVPLTIEEPPIQGDDTPAFGMNPVRLAS